MSDLRCPYLGCKKPMPCNLDIDSCPHCGRSINIVALAKSQDKELTYIQNPQNKGESNE